MKVNGTFAPANARRDAAQLLISSGRISVTIFTILALITGLILNFYPGQKAFAETPTGNPRPSVLLVDSSLGDFDIFKALWLGDSVEEVAVNEKIVLVTTDNPKWWTSSSTTDKSTSPSTFLLGSSAREPLDAADIVWALDEIAKTEAESKTFIVATGSSGLQARIYAEDLADIKQSARADLVGLAFLGTPHQGYSIASRYPKLPLWDTLASASKLQTTELLPGSDYLNNINSKPFPNIVKSLQINGSVGDLGFGSTDGATVLADMVLPTEVSTQVQNAQTRASVSQQVGLSFLWMPFTRTDGTEPNPVNSSLTEQLSAMDSYQSSAEVQAQTKEFYQAWFADGAPVTHVSTVLTLDISGSMLEYIGSGKTKLEEAKIAAEDYLQVVSVRSEKSYAVPTNVTTLAFNTQVNTVATGYDSGSIAALRGITAYNDTDVGQALQSSLDALSSAPRSAVKHVLFLSDGISTYGESEAQILAGPATRAKNAGVVIDTVAFGEVGQADIDFLQQIASITGGDFYQAKDTYGLRVSFLKAYYTSLGLNLFDAEVDLATGKSTIGDIKANTRSLEIGLLTDGANLNFKLFCNNTELAQDRYTVQIDDDGLTTIQIEYPAQGEYSLTFDGLNNRVHVFAVGQLDLFKNVAPAVEAQDFSLILIIGVAIALVVIIIILIVYQQLSRRRSARTSGDATVDADTFTAASYQLPIDSNTANTKKNDFFN